MWKTNDITYLIFKLNLVSIKTTGHPSHKSILIYNYLLGDIRQFQQLGVVIKSYPIFLF